MIVPAHRSLLIVDDDASLRRMLCWAFEDLGYLVWTAGNCRTALDSIEAMAFDCALVDYHLPDGTGCSLANGLRGQLPKLRLMVMSADPDSAVPASQTEAADGFMKKPLHMQLLHRWFSRATMQRMDSTKNA